MIIDVSFGRILKRRRRTLDITQEDLARRVGYSVVTIRKVEANERRPSRQLAERLASCLDVADGERQSFIRLARSIPDDGQATRRRNNAGPVASHAPAPVRPVNLPHPLTRLIGREPEVAALGELLTRPDVRLATLVGAPGIGKSRLAVRVAEDLRYAFADGVCLLGLTPIGDPTLVAPAIGRALGVEESVTRSPSDSLIDHLRDRQVLLMLDNFEHLLDAAPLVADLLAAAPGLKVLVTSRAALRLTGERLFPVPPLAFPPPHPSPPALASRYPAVELFVERTQAVRPTFVLTDRNVADVAAICASLDGLPLAIELVAARMILLTPQSVRARLDRRLALLTDGARDLPARQRTLRATLDWSHALLTPGEQTLLARLGVFADGCSLSAAEQVGNVYGDLPIPVLDGLAALAGKSLLQQEERDGVGRSYLLNTIRVYALERLAERGEEDDVRRRFAAYFLDFAEEAKAYLGGPHQETWLDRLQAEDSNLHMAMEWHIERGEVAPALRFVAALWRYWHIRGHQSGARRATGLVLALDGPHDPTLRAQVLYGAGWIAFDQTDHPQATAFFEEALALFRAAGDPVGVAEALHGVGIAAQADGDVARALTLFTESLATYRELGQDEGTAWSLDHLGRCRLALGDHGRAQRMFTESLTIFRRLDHAWGTAISLYHQGLAALAEGDHARAYDHINDGLTEFRQLANAWGISTSYDHLGYLALAVDDLPLAQAHFTRSLAMSQDTKSRNGVARSLAGMAAVALALGDMDRAAFLYGAVAVLDEPNRTCTSPLEESLHRRGVAAVHAEFGDGPARRAWSRGQSTPLHRTIAIALTPPAPPASSEPPPVDRWMSNM